MTNICFAGITGWTAPPILAAINATADLHLVAGVSRSAAGQSLADSTGVDAYGHVYASVVEALDATRVDVLIDYTTATAVMANCLTAIDKGVHVVIGSSGLDAGDYADIDARAEAAGVGVIAAGNFSVMAAILRRAATMAAEQLKHWEILDYGSDEKPDVPSGTSRELAEALAEVRTPTIRVPVEDLHGPTEARGASVAGTQVHSLRLPGFVVSTEIVFASTGERLVMRHDPGLTPDPYVDGTLLAIRKVAEQPGLRRGLDSLLFNTPTQR